MIKKLALLLATFYSVSFASNLTLSEAYDLALYHDPKTKAIAYRTKSQDDVVIQARSKLLPQLNANYTGGKQTYTNGIQYMMSDQPYGAWSFTFTQPLLHMSDSATISAEYIKRDGAEIEYKKQAQTLGLDVAKAYFNYIKTRSDEALSATEEQYFQSAYLKAKGMLEAGLVDKMQALQAEIDYKRAQANYLAKQKQVSVAQFGLEKLIGRQLENPVLLDPQTINFMALNPDKNYWESKLTSNLDILLAKNAYDVSQRQIHVRYGELTPTIDLQLSIYKVNTSNITATTNSQNAFVVINMPLSLGGYNYGRINEARMLSQASAQNFEASVRDAKLQFEDTWSKREFNIKTLELLKQAREVSALYVEAAEKQSQVGLKSSVDVYGAKKKLFEATKDYINASYELVNNELTLLFIVGDLNLDSMQTLEKNMYFATSK